MPSFAAKRFIIFILKTALAYHRTKTYVLCLDAVACQRLVQSISYITITGKLFLSSCLCYCCYLFFWVIQPFLLWLWKFYGCSWFRFKVQKTRHGIIFKSWKLCFKMLDFAALFVAVSLPTFFDGVRRRRRRRRRKNSETSLFHKSISNK